MLKMSKDERHSAMLNDLSDSRHGTKNGYATYRCRCSKCLEANRSDAAKYRNTGTSVKKHVATGSFGDDDHDGILNLSQRSSGMTRNRMITLTKERPKPTSSGLRFERHPIDEREARARAAGAL